jgi:hypothetical protein
LKENNCEFLFQSNGDIKIFKAKEVEILCDHHDYELFNGNLIFFEGVKYSKLAGVEQIHNLEKFEEMIKSVKRFSWISERKVKFMLFDLSFFKIETDSFLDFRKSISE